MVSLTACTSSVSPAPESLAVGIGFESVTDPETNWDEVRENFDAAGVDAFTISIGRPEWAGFAWNGQQDHWAPAIRRAEDAGRDLVREAIETLSLDTDRAVTLTVDVLSPLAVSEDEELAGAFPDGSAAEAFPSATALYQGEIGDRIVAMCGAAAQRYSPDRLAITELLGDTFFADSDEELFSEMTGRDGFPRTADGEVDLTDAAVTDWQSEIVTDLIQRCGEAAEIPVEMDVRVNWEDPGAGRPDSGHRYPDIYDTGAHLTLWAYSGLAGVPAESTADLAAGMKEQFSAEELSRTTLSTGLWSEGGSTQSPGDLVTAVRAAASVAEGPAEILITPLSMLTDEHWEALNELHTEAVDH